MKRAVIDIGTNSTRLYVAEIENSVQTPLFKDLATTRLGEGINRSNTMGGEPMRRTEKQICEFIKKAKDAGAEKIYVYATAVVREAKNKDEFTESVFKASGEKINVIPGELEGRIAYLGAAEGKKDAGVIDIGGGSTEVVTCFEGQMRALSQKTGGVRLKEMFETPSGRADTDKVREYVKNEFVPAYDAVTHISKARELIGVSGTPTTIASLSAGLKNYCPEKIQGAELSLNVLDGELQKLADMTGVQRAEYSGDFAPRADIIVYGGCILSAFMHFYGFDKITVSDRDSLEGYMEYMLQTEG